MNFPPYSPDPSGFDAAHQARAQCRQRMHQLEDEITELVGHIHAATFRLLELVREFDEGEGWGGDGVLSCAHWLNWKCGIGLGAAREKVRVAHALNDLPKISAAFRIGQISYSKVRAMTRVATAKNEEFLLMIARHGTATHVERHVRNYRMVQRLEALALDDHRHVQRELNWHIDEEGCWVLRGCFTPEQGALIQKVLEQVMEESFLEQQNVPAGTLSKAEQDNIHPRPQPIASRRADALARMAQGYSSAGKPCSSSDRYLVHVHTDLDTLRSDGTGAQAELDEGAAISADTARCLACDAGRVDWLENAAGEPLSVGRKTRTIPPAIRRALQRRDGGCRFPGCTCSRFVDAHHVQHWADGGETSLENLVLICRLHHRLVHEGGFGLNRTKSGGFRFTHPDGHILQDGPATRSRGNVSVLMDQHVANGIRITPKTAHSLWLGEPMDYNLAIQLMQQLE